jgi:hypothetical protein
MLALQNQLAPTVSVVVIHTTKPKARIRYELISTTTPAVNVTAVASRVAPSSRIGTHLTAVRSMSASDVTIALQCSAVAL